MSTICDDVLIKYFDDEILLKKCIDILMLLVLPPEEPYDITTLAKHPTSNKPYYECNLELLFSNPSSSSSDRIEIFIKLLKDEFSESIELQYNIIQILTVILLYKNTIHKLRSELNNIYGAFNTLNELLNSQQPFIRNSAVILLAHLSQNDPSIQKLIAFDGAFERLLTITRDELGVEGIHISIYFILALKIYNIYLSMF